jgi:dinuclear metal center YbgI/SA1388 family protein
MAQLPEIVQYLDDVLETPLFRDASLNGLQVDSAYLPCPCSDSRPRAEVTKAAFAVDAGESIVEAAITCGAQLLVVHHGIFWGQSPRLVGALGRKICRMMQSGLSLYVSHLPLDAHMTLGNNVGLAKFFGATGLEPFFEHEGRCIGCRGTLPQSLAREALSARGKELVQGTLSSQNGLPILLPFGPESIRTVGFLSGSGSSGIPAAAAAGLDLIISGEAKHESYHSCKELGINALFCGHYHTETFGVRALMNLVATQFGVQTEFVDHDSGF